MSCCIILQFTCVIPLYFLQLLYAILHYSMVHICYFTFFSTIIVCHFAFFYGTFNVFLSAFPFHFMYAIHVMIRMQSLQNEPFPSFSSFLVRNVEKRFLSRCYVEFASRAEIPLKQPLHGQCISCCDCAGTATKYNMILTLRFFWCNGYIEYSSHATSLLMQSLHRIWIPCCDSANAIITCDTQVMLHLCWCIHCMGWMSHATILLINALIALNMLLMLWFCRCSYWVCPSA